jgi:N-acyl-D-aspartate/D-glutamate deacylase
MNILIIALTVLQMNTGILQKTKRTKQEALTIEFMLDMRDGKDVRKYISRAFINENDLSIADWQVDYYLVKNFELTQLSDSLIQVRVDHGSGEYCTQFDIHVINENGKTKIKPTKIINQNKLKLKIIVPWGNVKKICS